MNAFEVVILIVIVVAIALAAISYFRPGGVLNQLGRGRASSFDHLEDHDLADRPSEDERDEPIPKRPLRGRPR